MSDTALPKTLFFFGAGASKPAGVGITSELVGEFTQFLTDENELKVLLAKVIESLDPGELDIESLMTAIEKLLGRDDDPILKFYDRNTFRINAADNIPLLQNKLKEFIQKTTSVREDKIDYLIPLLNFPKPLAIFSVNYDTAIEQLCNVRRLRYTDGFEYEWNYKLFDDDSFDFHLYKIHGSIMWYKTDKNNYVKLPIPPSSSQKLIFGEKAMPLMLYPMKKWEFVEPLLEMLLKFKKSLEEYDFAIVIGYSFRDSHIVRIFQEAARRNKNLIVILVGPSARERYEQKLKFYLDENGNKTIVPSLLEDRVLCLQYGFENIIIKLKEITDKCNVALMRENEFKQNMIAGKEVDPTNFISILADIEFLDRVDGLRDKIQWPKYSMPGRFSISLLVSAFKLFLSSEIQGRHENANYWLTNLLKFMDLIVSYLRDNLQISFDNVKLNLQHDMDAKLLDDLHDLQNFILYQEKSRPRELTELIKYLISKIREWIDFVYSWRGETTYEQISFQVSYLESIHGISLTNEEAPIMALLNSSGNYADGDPRPMLDLINTLQNKTISSFLGGTITYLDHMKDKFPDRILST